MSKIITSPLDGFWLAYFDGTEPGDPIGVCYGTTEREAVANLRERSEDVGFEADSDDEQEAA